MRSAVLTATAVLALGCSAGREVARTSTAAAAPPVITVTVADAGFQAPDTVPAGWTTFRVANRSDQPHWAQLIRLEDGHTLEEYVQVYAEAFRTRGPRPEWARRLGGPGVVAPRGTSNATQTWSRAATPGPNSWTPWKARPT